jgi:crossover junction endodeoxyribonuclease RuvC
MVFVGIDPGLQGAIAFVDSEVPGQMSSLGARVFDMPVIKIGKRHDYVVPNLVSFFLDKRGESPLADVLVGIESLHAMPSSMCSGVGNFSLGRSSGVFEGIFASLHIPFQKIPPQRWKKVMLDGLPKEKGSSVVVAKRLFPGVSLSRVKDHGRADALLIAEFCRRTYGK